MVDNNEINTCKYNHGESIPLDLIPIEECELALRQFANGSIGLEKCLREMWMHGLKTHSCNPGSKNSFDVGHIVMEEEEDIFSYLSDEFITDPRIRIDVIDNMQEVKFAGTSPEKEGALLFLTREIQKGKKKNNRELIEENIGQPYPDGWVRRLRTHDSNINSTYWGEKIILQRKPHYGEK